MAAAFVGCLVDYAAAKRSDIGPHITAVYTEQPGDAPDGVDLFDLWLDAVEDALDGLPGVAQATDAVEMLGEAGDVPVATVDCPGLHTFRQRVLANLAAFGATAPATWPDYRPHITLDSADALTPQSLTLGPVLVRLGEQRFTFGSAQLAELSAEDRRPTQTMADAAQAVIDAREGLPNSKRGLTPVGERRLHQIARREPLSIDTIRRIRDFDSRNRRFADAERLSKAWQAWGAWGGDTAGAWARRQLSKAAGESEARNSEVADEVDAQWAEACRGDLQRPQRYRDPGRLFVGQPFRTTATGNVYNRRTGQQSGQSIDAELLDDAIRFFECGEEVPITFEHEQTETLGRVLAMWRVDDGDRQSLAVLPGYTTAGRAYVERRDGVLWSSPHLQWGNFFNPRSREPVGRLRV